MRHVFLNLAWRNVWRNKRRSIITIAAIAFAILMAAITRSMQYGSYHVMESMAVSLYNGDLQIHRKGFQENHTLSYSLDSNEQNWQSLIEKDPRLTGFARRLTGFGLVGSDSASAGALIVGIEPERELRLTQFANMVRYGEKLNNDDDHRVLIGTTLAKNLQLHIGDSLVVLTQGYHNQLGADKYLVKGLVSVGQTDLDRSLMIMSLKNAQELFSLYDGITEVVFRTEDFRKATTLSKEMSKELDGGKYEVLSWKQMMPELEQIIIVDNVSGAIYLAFILIVVGIEIFNAVMMNVLERTREFGVIQAIGMKPNQISGLLFLEFLFKITLALIIGWIISFVAISILTHNTIPLPADLREAYATYGFVIENLEFSDGPRVFLEPLISIAVIGMIAFVFPFMKASKLTPVDAFRKV